MAGGLVDPAGGRVALVLPQSLLASRDAEAIRGSIGGRARMVWSWWSDRHVFDAQTGEPREFISGYHNDVVPNLWDRSQETAAN